VHLLQQPVRVQLLSGGPRDVLRCLESTRLRQWGPPASPYCTSYSNRDPQCMCCFSWFGVPSRHTTHAHCLGVSLTLISPKWVICVPSVSVSSQLLVVSSLANIVSFRSDSIFALFFRIWPHGLLSLLVVLSDSSRPLGSSDRRLDPA
jgi:hypothetical protein